ncbi:MAG: PIG-L family deacetylase [Bryobacteraceae bacterium]|nr:PIG-L family deacetylase [Bryobacteraceae bacterium]
MRIVSIHAHPDDAEILAGGTLASLAQRGHDLAIVTMTPGDKGSDKLPPDEIAAVRRLEAETAAMLIGAEYRCAEFRDLEIFSDHASRLRVVELIRQLRPDLVLTASPTDYLCDHEATSALVRDALFAAPARNYVTDSPPLDRIPHLYFMDPIDDIVEVDFVVDVAGTFEIKRAMLAAHASQREWLRRQHGMDDYLASMEAWTQRRGGEGFRQYRKHPYPQSPLLQELLGLS